MILGSNHTGTYNTIFHSPRSLSAPYNCSSSSSSYSESDESPFTIARVAAAFKAQLTAGLDAVGLAEAEALEVLGGAGQR